MPSHPLARAETSTTDRRRAVRRPATAVPGQQQWVPSVGSGKATYQQAIKEGDGGSVWQGGSEHILSQYARSNYQRLSSNITKNGNQKSDKWLTVNHDIVEQTANNLTEFMLSTLTQAGYKAVTVGECLGDPKAFWYRNGDGSATVYNEKEEEKNQGGNSTNPGNNSTNPDQNHNNNNNGNNSTNQNNPGSNRNPGGGGATEGNQTNNGTPGQNNQQGAAVSQRGYVTGVVSVAAMVVLGVMMV